MQSGELHFVASICRSCVRASNTIETASAEKLRLDSQTFHIKVNACMTRGIGMLTICGAESLVHNHFITTLFKKFIPSRTRILALLQQKCICLI